jgi:hypothetical protein
MPGPTFLRAASRYARRTPVGLLRFLVAWPWCGDLLLSAKHLFSAARTVVHRQTCCDGRKPSAPLKADWPFPTRLWTLGTPPRPRARPHHRQHGAVSTWDEILQAGYKEARRPSFFRPAHRMIW